MTLLRGSSKKMHKQLAVSINAQMGQVLCIFSALEESRNDRNGRFGERNLANKNCKTEGPLNTSCLICLFSRPNLIKGRSYKYKIYPIKIYNLKLYYSNIRRFPATSQTTNRNHIHLDFGGETLREQNRLSEETYKS